MLSKSLLVVSGEQRLAGRQDFCCGHVLEWKLSQRVLVYGDAFASDDVKPAIVGFADKTVRGLSHHGE